MRWKFGVWIGPPKVLVAAKPTSSVRINRTLGAPAGASTPFGKSGVDSLTVRPIFPWKGGSGFGSTTSSSAASAGRGGIAKASVDAVTREVEPSNRCRRLMSSRPALSLLVALSSFIALPD